MPPVVVISMWWECRTREILVEKLWNVTVAKSVLFSLGYKGGGRSMISMFTQSPPKAKAGENCRLVEPL